MTVNLHAQFTPEGSDPKDTGMFAEFSLAAVARIQKLRQREDAEERARFDRLKAADRKAQPIVLSVLRDEMTVEDAAEKLKQTVPDKSLARELLEIWDKAVKATPDQIAREKEDIARQEREFEQSRKLLKASAAVHRGLTTLVEATRSGNAAAAEYLAEAAIDAVTLLQIVETTEPDLLRTVSKKQMQWPVLASEEPGWEKQAARRLAHLNVGADLRLLKVGLRKPRGTDANLPARLWARAAVQTIEQTRLRFLMFGQILREFGSHEALADFCLETGWDIGKRPGWLDQVAMLNGFCQESLPQWKAAIRAMIREETPDFHTRAEWITQRNTAAANARTTTGDVQNAILDDIASALTRLAPGKDC